VKKNIVLKYLKWLWIVAVVVFIGYYFYKHLPEELQYLKTIQLNNILFSVLLLFSAKLLIVELAHQSVKKGAWQPSYLQMFSIVTISQLGKYIPGSIWHFAARINSYKENSLSNKKTAKVMVLENLWLVSGAFAFGLLMLTIQPPYALFENLIAFNIPSLVWKISPFVILIVWVLGLLLLDNLFPSEKNKFSVKRIAWLILIQSGIWAALGGSFFLVFQNIGLNNLWLVIGGYAISWIVGYVVIFAPGGIGVREFVLVTLFSSILPSEQIAIYTIVHRLIYTAVEVLLGIGGFFVQKKYFAQPNSSDKEKTSSAESLEES
jgi:glycosyltransferase 2 family protein